MKIGYDLDGVLISDLNWPHGMSLKEFLEMRKSEPLPNFIPKGDYVIVTGRNNTDLQYTTDWVTANLKSNPPMRVFHDCEDYREAKHYKQKIINEQAIDVFIESDIMQVEHLAKHCPNCRVYHFGSWVSEKISRL